MLYLFPSPLGDLPGFGWVGRLWDKLWDPLVRGAAGPLSRWNGLDAPAVALAILPCGAAGRLGHLVVVGGAHGKLPVLPNIGRRLP